MPWSIDSVVWLLDTFCDNITPVWLLQNAVNPKDITPVHYLPALLFLLCHSLFLKNKTVKSHFDFAGNVY